MANTTSPTPATVQNLVNQMNQKHSVLNGWDVVFNMLEDEVNQIFQMTFRKTAKTTWTNIDISYCECFPNPSGSGQIACYTKLHYVLDNPNLSFVPGKSNFMHIQFDAFGSINLASKYVDDSFDPLKNANPNDPELSWELSEEENIEFIAEVPLSVVQGSVVQTSYSYVSVLNFPAGSFDSPLFIQVQDNDRLQQELRNYFSTHNVCYVMNQLNEKVSNQPPELTPRFFRTGTVFTNCGKKILSLFICTTGTVKDCLTINVNEPIPDGMDLSIMINHSIAAKLGVSSIPPAYLGAIENLIFPAENIISVGPQYPPYDLLVLGKFNLSDKILKILGDNQSVERIGIDIPGGKAFFAPIEVQVSDAMGNPLAGKQVTFKVVSNIPEMAIQINYGEEYQIATLSTNTDGKVVLDRLSGNSAVAYYANGPFSINASVAEGAQTSFQMTTLPAKPQPLIPGSKVLIVSGDKQSMSRTPSDTINSGIAKFAPLTVQLVDAHNQPIPNAMVNFKAGKHPEYMSVQVHPLGAEPTTVITDAQGKAILQQMNGNYSVYAYYATGQFQVTASVAGGTPANFTLNVTDF